MIRRIQHKHKSIVKTWVNNDNHKDEYHFETHLVTTYYLLFIPIYSSKTLLQSTI